MFHPEGWDWPWLSWRQAARRVALWAGPLSALPRGGRVAFAWTGHPASVILDLAIQAAGLISVPAPPAKLAALGCRTWAAPEGTAVPELPKGFDAVRLPAWQRPDLTREEILLPDADPEGGGAVAEEDGVQFDVKAEDLAAAIPETEGGREIAVLGGPLLAAAERRMLAWATAAGAAVLLDPDPSRRISTAVWARPTVFHGTAAELSRLRAAVEREERSVWRRPWRPWRRHPRPPFGRLRTVVPTESLSLEDSSFWVERGVRVVRWSPLRAG